MLGQGIWLTERLDHESTDACLKDQNSRFSLFQILLAARPTLRLRI